MNFKMKQPILSNAGLKVALLGTAIVSAATPAQTVDDKPEVKKEILNSVSNTINLRAFVPGVDFKKWNTFLENERAKIEAAKNDDEFKTALNAALRKFGFSHIALATPKDWNTRTTGTTVGIGITSQPAEGGRVITRVVEGGPAADAGLEPGDTIILFDGKPVTDATVMTGTEGSIAKIRIKKSTGKTFDYEIKRRPFSTVRKDEVKWINDKTAVVKINTFDRAYNKGTVADLMKEAVKAKNLVIDLRNNGGGAVLNLFDFAGYFLEPELKLGSFLDRRALDRYKKEVQAEPADLAVLTPFSFDLMRPVPQKLKFRGNVSILINGGTGSASEIFTSAMREWYGKYSVDESGTIIAAKENFQVSIVGNKSAGAVLFSTYAPVGNGFYLQYPLADYLTPNGNRLEGNPIEPDVKVDEFTAWKKDQPDKAIETSVVIFERLARIQSGK